MVNNKPMVSVIMPVFNSEKYLGEAIESILNQTFEDFEFLIFDDGSTDGSKNIIKEYANKDTRIKAYYSDKNCGYVVHLNKGIDIAKGKYIARMDSDDISMPTRFKKQVDYLLSNNNIGILGTSSIWINENGTEITRSRKQNDYQLLHFLSYFINPISHPSVMFRRSIAIKLNSYDPTKMPAEDYDLWIRALLITNIVCLKEYLIFYRIHSASISQTGQQKQKNSFYLIQKRHLKNLTGLSFPQYILSFLNNSENRRDAKYFIQEKNDALLQIYNHFILKEQLGYKKKRFLKEFIFNKMFALSLRAYKESKIVGIRLLIGSFFFSIRSFCKTIILYFAKRTYLFRSVLDRIILNQF